ncbi:MAG: alpha/beta fold hydrolase [Gallionella sp.]
MQTRALILPGYNDSDPGHWQSLWQTAQPNFSRVQQRDWDNPVCAEWVANLEKAVALAGENVVLVAHSLGCLLVAHWAAQTQLKIKGALLAAPPDPTATDFPKEIRGFAPLPMQALKFPSIIVASSDDPYGDLIFAQFCAVAWRSHFVNIGAAGHINTASGLGSWRVGFALYQQLAA